MLVSPLRVNPDDLSDLEHVFCHRTPVVSNGGLYLEDRHHSIACVCVAREGRARAYRLI